MKASVAYDQDLSRTVALREGIKKVTIRTSNWMTGH